MMKLNEKGFAFSTMLYGTLALLTLTLYVILDVSKTSYDETYYYGDTIELQLIECTEEELQVEKCYSTGNPYCDLKTYHTCLGVSDDTTQPQGNLLINTIKGTAVTTGDGVYAEGTEVKRYYYKGTNVNNYIKIKNSIYRIVSVEADGTIKLIDYNHPIQTMWHTGGIGGLIWEKINLSKQLNLSEEVTGSYLKSLAEAEVTPVLGEWKSVFVYPSEGTGGSGAFKLDNFNSQKTAQGQNITNYAKVGVLSIDDYIKATNGTTFTTCSNNMFGATNCSSWLSPYGGWTNNINAEAVGYVNDGVVVQDPSSNGQLLLTNYVYYFDITTKSIITAPAGETRTAYPVFYIDRNTIVKGGSGTSSDPYIVQ